MGQCMATSQPGRGSAALFCPSYLLGLLSYLQLDLSSLDHVQHCWLDIVLDPKLNLLKHAMMAASVTNTPRSPWKSVTPMLLFSCFCLLVGDVLFGYDTASFGGILANPVSLLRPQSAVWTMR